MRNYRLSPTLSTHAIDFDQINDSKRASDKTIDCLLLKDVALNKQFRTRLMTENFRE